MKPVVLRHSGEDHCGSLSEDCRVRHDHMDSLKVSTKFRSEQVSCFCQSSCFRTISLLCLNKQPECEEPPEARYPQPSPTRPSPSLTQPARTAVSRIEQVQVATSGERNTSVCVRNTRRQRVNWSFCTEMKRIMKSVLFVLELLKVFINPRRLGARDRSLMTKCFLTRSFCLKENCLVT